MVLVNAPVPCADPALHAVEMAIDMQKVVQNLITVWRSRGYTIGFGVGLAMGLATVGRIGYESRVEYTAIGNVVNLASRLCSSAEDEQILIDSALAEAVRDKLSLVALGTRRFKGFDKELAVYSAGSRDGQEHATSDTSHSPNTGLGD
jgi:class 3 adenylate cyclase